MNYLDLLDRLFERYGDKRGIVSGEPVQLIYVISKTAERIGFESVVDIERLSRMLRKTDIIENLVREFLTEVCAAA